MLLVIVRQSLERQCLGSFTRWQERHDDICVVTTSTLGLHQTRLQFSDSLASPVKTHETADRSEVISEDEIFSPLLLFVGSVRARFRCAERQFHLKDFDPVKKGTQWPDFPKKLILTDDDWGKYSVDAATAIRMQQLHPDLLEVDIISGKEITQRRLQRNHVNINFWYDVGVAMLNARQRMYGMMWTVELTSACRVYSAMLSFCMCVFCLGVNEQGGIKHSVAPELN